MELRDVAVAARHRTVHDVIDRLDVEPDVGSGHVD